jgi:hypothetical protein
MRLARNPVSVRFVVKNPKHHAERDAKKMWRDRKHSYTRAVRSSTEKEMARARSGGMDPRGSSFTFNTAPREYVSIYSVPNHGKLSSNFYLMAELRPMGSRYRYGPQKV